MSYFSICTIITNMTNKIPEEILQAYKKLQNSDFELYLVGGCVRDLLLGREVKDWDFTTNARPEDLQKIFTHSFYDNKFGTVGIPLKINYEEHVLEVTTYRTEKGYVDRRHPEKVEWGKTVEEDLSRRDFTINSIALSIPPGRWPKDSFQVNIIDPFNGQKDIKEKIIRAVGDPKLRFKEDALRLIRAVRLATQLSFTIEPNTWDELVKDADLISEISWERIRDELFKILESDYPSEGIILLKNAGLLIHILPELLEGIDVSQARPGRHHTTDVFTHNILSLKFCPSKDPLVKFATLIHDIGKPKSRGLDEKGLSIFYNHEIISSQMAWEICDRLKLSRKQKEKVANLIRWHMFSVSEEVTDTAVRRFIRRVGVENVKDMIDLRIGDRLGGGTQKAESWRLKRFKKMIEKQLNPPFSINDLVIDGRDVMRILDIKPGPKVGEILQKLFEEVDEDLSKNNKEYLIQRIHEFAI